MSEDKPGREDGQARPSGPDGADADGRVPSGATAFDAAYAACRRRGRVSVARTTGAPAAVRCAEVTRARPAYVDVTQ